MTASGEENSALIGFWKSEFKLYKTVLTFNKSSCFSFKKLYERIYAFDVECGCE